MRRFTLAATALSLAWSACAFAAVSEVTWDFRRGGSEVTVTGSGFGNRMTFTENGHAVLVRAYSDTIDGTGGSFNAARLLRSSTGLGVCGPQEGSRCRNPLRQVDNVGLEDWVLFTFDRVWALDSIVIDPRGFWDRDVTYWIGTGLSEGLAGKSFATDIFPAFGPGTTVRNSAGSAPLSIGLHRIGDFLLFGAAQDYTGGSVRTRADRFRITSVTAVPESTTWVTLGVGLMVIAARRMRRLS